MYGAHSMHDADGAGAYGACYAEQGMGGKAGGKNAMMEKSPFGQRRYRPASLAVLAVCLLLPCAIFSAVFSLESLSMRYSDTGTVMVLVCLAGLIVLLLGWFALRTWLRRDDGAQDPKWYTFLFVTSAVAWVSGMVLGDKNFQAHTSPYHDFMHLGVYKDVSPASYRGQQLMDAGRMDFTRGSHLDTSKAMGFKSLDTYCVAPVVSAPNQTSTAGANPGVSAMADYDFWAVGINCCSGFMLGDTPDFHCGEVDNSNARSGLRLIHEDLRSYFRLAVQQAEAAHNIQATHPIFMYWMQDPAGEIESYQELAYRYWFIGLGVFCGCQLLALIAAVVASSKLGV